jgi:hypothetical protein
MELSEGNLVLAGLLALADLVGVGATGEADPAHDWCFDRLGAFLGLPLAVDEPSGDGNGAARGQIIGACLSAGPTVAALR